MWFGGGPDVQSPLGDNTLIDLCKNIITENSYKNKSEMTRREKRSKIKNKTTTQHKNTK